jgi:hypothetical protein
MKKLIAALAFFVGFTANANMITLELSDTAVTAGDTIQVTVLGSFSEEFDTLFFDLDFDTSALTFVGSSFYSELTAYVDPTWDYFSVASESFGVSLALLLDFLSFPITAGDYVLAQFDLTANSGSYTSLSLTNQLVASANSPNGFEVDVVGGTQSIAVSAPSALSLFAVSLLAFAGFRRKA